MNIHTPHVTPEQLASAIAEAVELGKKDARAGLDSRGPDELPEGLEVAWAQYEESFEAELVLMGHEQAGN